MFNIFHCCGKTAKPVVKPIVDLFVAIGVALAGLLILTYYPDYLLTQASPGAEKVQKTPSIVLIILLAIFFFLEACLFALIQSATRERDPGQCDNWFKIRLILLCILVFGVIYYLISSVNVEEIYIAGGICLFVVLYRVYTLMTVRAFYLEIKTSKQQDLGYVLRRIL